MEKWKNSYTSYPYVIRANNKHISAGRYIGGTVQDSTENQSVFYQPAKFDYNNYQNITVTFSPDDSVRLYFNNILVDITDNKMKPGSIQNNHNLYIGRRGEILTRFFKGEIDDIRIYNRALNRVEIEDIFKEGTCYKTITTNIIVQDTLNIYLSQIITTVYTPSSAATTVKVYPNPTSKNLTVEIDKPNNLSGVTIKVMDAQSSVVHNEFVTGSTQSIDVSNWSSGIYFLHIINGNTTVDVRKIVVNN